MGRVNTHTLCDPKGSSVMRFLSPHRRRGRRVSTQAHLPAHSGVVSRAPTCLLARAPAPRSRLLWVPGSNAHRRARGGPAGSGGTRRGRLLHPIQSREDLGVGGDDKGVKLGLYAGKLPNE